jgi:hypothetical protein
MLRQVSCWIFVLLVFFAGFSAWQRSTSAEKQAEPVAQETPLPDELRFPLGPSPLEAEAVDQDIPSLESIKEPGTNLVRLTKDYPIWIDPVRKLVAVDGAVCLREGLLEMFACPRGTKEHESIVAVDARAQYVHAALLAVGAKPGRPVQFAPEYSPATGTIVDIIVLWIDQDGKRHKARAQDWIRYQKTDKPMTYDWVFAGSGFWTDEYSGERLYYGDGGDFICVSNFATATLDLPVASSQDNADLLFSALTENIPPLGTKVRLVLIPRLEK